MSRDDTSIYFFGLSNFKRYLYLYCTLSEVDDHFPELYKVAPELLQLVNCQVQSKLHFAGSPIKVVLCSTTFNKYLSRHLLTVCRNLELFCQTTERWKKIPTVCC